ncbi:MAG: HNH endonuclease [Terriglobales bacterium]
MKRELTGRESEPSELIYFKVYKSQAPVIEQAIDTAALMLGSDKSRGYCLEMICADFLAGAHVENGDPKILLFSMLRLFRFSASRAEAGIPAAGSGGCVKPFPANRRRIRLGTNAYHRLHQEILKRDDWRCQACGSLRGLEVHHIQRRNQSCDDSEGNLITLCSDCHRAIHA